VEALRKLWLGDLTVFHSPPTGGNKKQGKETFHLAFKAPTFRRCDVSWVLRQIALAPHSRKGPQGTLTAGTIFTTSKRMKAFVPLSPEFVICLPPRLQEFSLHDWKSLD